MGSIIVSALMGFAAALFIVAFHGNPRADQLEADIKRTQAHRDRLAESVTEWRSNALNMERQRDNAYRDLDRIQNVLDGHTEDQ